MSARGAVFEGVSKRFGRGPAVLDGFSLALEPGRRMALLGASGSGKSTALRLLAGLESPDAGTIRLGDQVVASASRSVPAFRRRVGLVFQELELWPHRTTAENVAFGLPGRPRGRAALRHPRVVALAERLGIGALLARSPADLSGGERQRAALARTLAPEPDVLLLDEPLRALDAPRRADLLALLAELTGAGRLTTLVVTHDPEEALALGEHVAVLGDGRVVEQGPGQALHERPRTATAARALGDANLVPAKREGPAWRTALGLLPAAREDDRDAAHVLVRPADLHVRPGADAVARVLACWGRGRGFAARVTLGDLVLSGTSLEPLAPGAPVVLSVDGPVVGVS